MDPVSHAAFSRTLAGALPSTRQLDGLPRGCVVAAVVGSLFPDLDAVVMPFGWDRYLRVHEVGTHTIAGTAACALAIAAAMHVLARPTRYSLLAVLAWIGAASHVLLDVLSGARIRPGWPLVETVVSLPIVAMADPWLLALCVAGPVALWVAPRSRRRHAAVVVLTVTSVFLLGKGVLGTLAFSHYKSASERSGEIVLARVVEARWASLDDWAMFDRTASHVRSWTSAAGGGPDEVLSWPLGPETTPVRTSRSLSTVRNFLRVHELGFAVTLPQREGRTVVLWSDIRFCWDPALPGARKLEPIVQSASGDGQIACALWFGGELDSDGRPSLEIVKVGGFTQTRAPAR